MFRWNQHPLVTFISSHIIDYPTLVSYVGLCLFNQILTGFFLAINLILIKTKNETATKKKLINLKLYKGFWHKDGLPVRRQRTHTNAKIQKKFKLGLNTTLKNKKWKKTKV
jgi:hypothetical protein